MTTKLHAALGSFGLATLTASAAPFLTLGDGSELFLTTTVGVESNNNVALSERELSDTIFEVAPGLSLLFGNNALVSGSLTYVESITRYAEHDRFEAELSHLAFNGRYAEENTEFNAYASFVQLNQNTVDLRNPGSNELARRDVATVGGNGEWEMTPKIGMSFGVDYRRLDFKRAGFVDRELTSIPFGFFYEMTPKVDVSLGVRLREIELDRTGGDFSDRYYSLGARGEFTPKLSGTFTLGVTTRDQDVGDDRTMLGLASDFRYVFSEKTTVTFGAANDFGNSATGETQENTDLYIGARSALTPGFGVSGRIYYRSIDYSVRPDDDYLEAQVIADYAVNQLITVSGAIIVRNNESDLAGGDFENTVLRLAAHLRY